MGTEAREILFIDNNGTMIHRLPLDSYVAGNIQATKESLAKELGLSPDDIRAKIKGIQRGRSRKGSLLRVQLLDTKAVRDFFLGNT
jgi:hypothetical protein